MNRKEERWRLDESRSVMVLGTRDQELDDVSWLRRIEPATITGGKREIRW
jgi:hypothetical protein